MTRNLAAGPAPDLQQPGVEIGILFQGGEESKRVPSLSQEEISETKSRNSALSMLSWRSDQGY